MHINDLGLEFDVIYDSPAYRIVETWKKFWATKKRPRLIKAEELYEATENLFNAFVNRIDRKFNNVIIVAHNPVIAQVYAHYALDLKDFSPATSALLSFGVDDWKLISVHMAEGKDYYYPDMRQTFVSDSSPMNQNCR